MATETKLKKILDAIDDNGKTHYKIVTDGKVGLLCRLKCDQNEVVTGDAEKVTCPKCIWILLAEQNFIPQQSFSLH